MEEEEEGEKATMAAAGEGFVVVATVDMERRAGKFGVKLAVEGLEFDA